MAGLLTASVATIAWLKQDSKSYIVAELCRRAIGPESLIHRKLGPWQWQGESALSVLSYSLATDAITRFYVAM